MFDSITARNLRAAPAVPGLDPKDLPAILTWHYAELVSARLRAKPLETAASIDSWTLSRIADTYEMVASLHKNRDLRRAASFVAGTAQQLLARVEATLKPKEILSNLTRVSVDPTISASLLFLAAEQYADANEASNFIKPFHAGQALEVTILSGNIRDLARGHLTKILERAEKWREQDTKPAVELEEIATKALYEALICGIELLAAEVLDLKPPLETVSKFQFANSRHAFQEVKRLSSNTSNVSVLKDVDFELTTNYSGPRHLASLLLSALDGISEAALIKTPSPSGADANIWKKWIRFRAEKFPFIWPNHREAVGQGFHLPGKSAVLVLPTGAGKTTVSALKIAGVLSQGKKVIFLAPTHALVEQLKEDLGDMFPEDVVGRTVSNDFDLLMLSSSTFQDIEVMTPESCLALLCFSPEAISDVGLLVFDECHLLSPQSGKIRRALDSMLCVLAFSHIAPEADFLFLSAMLKNGQEFSDWVKSLTQRDCICIDLLWKPSRQARGVVVYEEDSLGEILNEALEVQKRLNLKRGKIAKGLGKQAQNKLLAHPYAVWGLQHNWNTGANLACYFSKISENPVQLSVSKNKRGFYLTPNANDVAAELAINATKNSLKTIVFVNQKAHAISVASQICGELKENIESNEVEDARWEALKEELGDLNHSLLKKGSVAVPHNASMFRLERDLAERMFRRPKGAKVIVATPTLAQGLNLPAHLAILAGDKRAGTEEGKREALEPHELLNAAGRAGRAGHLANGIVLLIPEPNLTFKENSVSSELVDKLQSILPEDDRCLTISDPLEIILDRVMQGNLIDRDVRYTLNRMRPLDATKSSVDGLTMFNFNRSLAAFSANKKVTKAEFEERIKKFKALLDEDTKKSMEQAISMLSSQSGLSPELLQRLKNRIESGLVSLPNTINDWLTWTIDWLKEDQDACVALLEDETAAIRGAVGLSKKGELDSEILEALKPGLMAWTSGKTIRAIEKSLGGKPDTEEDHLCPRARELVSTVIPRGLSFVVGLIAHIGQEVKNEKDLDALNGEVLECLRTAIRRGFNSPELIDFASNNKNILSRVQVHKAYEAELISEAH